MKKALVIGVSGGIGKALAENLRNDGVQTFGLTRVDCDLRFEECIEAAAKKIQPEAPFDFIFLATGLLHNDQIQPEKSIRQISQKDMESVFSINTFAPILVLKHFLPLLDKNHRSVFAALSAKVGSISDNRLGGWYSYRASKAALNMLLKTASIELQRTNPNVIIAALHPGTVNTKLSEPFQSRVPAGKLFTPEDCAQKLLTVIDALKSEDSGKLFSWSGHEIPF